MNNWRKTTLGDVCELLYGKSLTANKREKGNIPVYSSAGITGWHNKPLVNNRGIIVGRKGTVGTVYLSEVPFYCIDTAYYILPNDDIYNFKYLYYRLKSLGLNKLNEDSAVPGLNRDNAYSQEFNLPPLDEQKRIADVLSALDDKIEINNKINENLEAQAQAIFKQWFVDFEFPDSEGKQYKSNGGKFIDSELGQIPEGWKVGTLGDVTSEIIRGFTSKYVEKSNLINLNQKVNQGRILDKQYYKYLDENYEVPPNKFLRKKDILLNSLGQGTLGRIHYFMENANNIVADQHITIIRTDNNNLSSPYLYLLLSSDLYKTVFESKISGSTGMLMLNISMVRNTDIIVPKADLNVEFDEIINCLFEKINANIMENQTLSGIRDSLLPRLMNGAVRV